MGVDRRLGRRPTSGLDCLEKRVLETGWIDNLSGSDRVVVVNMNGPVDRDMLCADPSVSILISGSPHVQMSLPIMLIANLMKVETSWAASDRIGLGKSRERQGGQNKHGDCRGSDGSISHGTFLLRQRRIGSFVPTGVNPNWSHCIRSQTSTEKRLACARP